MATIGSQDLASHAKLLILHNVQIEARRSTDSALKSPG